MADEKAERSINFLGGAQGNINQTGDNNSAFLSNEIAVSDVEEIKRSFAEIAKAFKQLETTESRKIQRAFEDINDELDRPSPNKKEVSNALVRVVDYGSKCNGFISLCEKLKTPLGQIASWLGTNWQQVEQFLRHSGL